MKYGLHIATGGNLLKAAARAAELKVPVMQIFASNPRGWKATVYSDDQAKAFTEATKSAGLEQTFVHMIYLVSYGSANSDLRQKSIDALITALQTADQLGVSGVVTHLGSHQGLGFDQALKRLADGIMPALDKSKTANVILENSAGAGGNMGNSLEELGAIIKAMGNHPRVKVCLDTCHLLASGYEIRTKAGLDQFLADFDKLIGLDRLAVMHLNDSKGDLGSKRDRHENIGDGYIGKAGFKVILNHPKLKNVPGVLEVPGIENKGPDKANLDRLYALTK